MSYNFAGGGSNLLLYRRFLLMKKKKDDGLPLNVDLSEIYGVVNGKILNTNGEVDGWGPGSVSNYIPIKDTYTFDLFTTCGNWNKVGYYDENKVFISVETFGTAKYGNFQFGANTDYPIPSNASFMRVQLRGQSEGVPYIKRID